MRILVIGGTGTIGFHVSKQLAEAGNDVCILHRGQTVRDLPLGVRPVTSCDPTPLRLHEFLREALRFLPDAVIHMIAMCDEDVKAAMNALKGSPNLAQTTTCTSSLLHTRHNKISEMQIRHCSGCPQGAQNQVMRTNRSCRRRRAAPLERVFADVDCPQACSRYIFIFRRARFGWRER